MAHITTFEFLFPIGSNWKKNLTFVLFSPRYRQTRGEKDANARGSERVEYLKYYVFTISLGLLTVIGLFITDMAMRPVPSNRFYWTVMGVGAILSLITFIGYLDLRIRWRMWSKRRIRYQKAILQHKRKRYLQRLGQINDWALEEKKRINSEKIRKTQKLTTQINELKAQIAGLSLEEELIDGKVSEKAMLSKNTKVIPLHVGEEEKKANGTK